MVFSSNVFLFAFLPVVLTAYYITPCKFRNIVLLTASLFFYSWGEPIYLFLMVAVIVINYCGALVMEAAGKDEKKRHRALTFSLVLDLSLLVFFKYSFFLAETVNSLLPYSMRINVPNIPLPIGISFYVFQSISYTIDVYRRTAAVQHSLVKFSTYISLFPQLIAGPIVRYGDIEQQLSSRHESWEDFSSGAMLFVIGLSKKLLLGNNMGALWEVLKTGDGTLSAWVGMIAYTLQIYFDFSGYSDMAIGLGKMLGFTFPLNFDYPYISISITEFWRRWHISLSTWFKEYVYIPLGGNRLGLPRQLLNILIVWALTGLWHGASWNFVLWGVYYAFWLCLEKLFLLKKSARLPRVLKHIGVLLIVSYGWMIFYFDDLRLLKGFTGNLFSSTAESIYSLNTIFAYLPILLISVFAATPVMTRWTEKLPKKAKNVFNAITMAILLLLCSASLSSQSYNPFIYFRF